MYNSYAYHPELFRFTDHYEDVFIDGENYLYACAEAFDYNGSYTVCEYEKLDNDYWLTYDHAGASYAYLMSLDHAPYDVAKDVMIMEKKLAIEYEVPKEEQEHYDDEFIEEYYVSQWDDEYQEWHDDYEEDAS